MTPVVGQLAPDFTLASTSGQNVRLSEFRGQHNVLLAFFPLAFTSTCTAELCSFTDDFRSFASADTVILPISVDAVPSLNAFKKQEKYGVDLLSDFKRDVSRAYGVLNPDKYYSNRSYFLIDRKGVLRWSLVEEHNGLKRSDEELLAEIAKLG